MNGVRRIYLSMTLSAMLLIAGISPSWAAPVTYNFSAISNTIEGTNFTLSYTDYDNDGKFSLDELVAGSFSGVQFYWTDWGWVSYNAIRNVPSYQDNPYQRLVDGDSPGWWAFGPIQHPGYDEYPTMYWTLYQTSPVPVPPAALLLGTGLVGLASWRRLRRG